MKTLKSILLIGLSFIVLTSNAQQVGKIDMKPEAMAGKKFNETEKKIFIQHFFVNYQTMMSQSEIARGGREMGGGRRGDAKASLSLGIKGVNPDQLQIMTDKFYADYIAQLEGAGFTIMSPDEVKKNEHFADWKKIQGGTASASHIPGYVSTSPNGFEYLYSKGSIFNPLGMTESNKLGGIIVARVNVTVPFVENAESQGSKALTKSFGGVAKIVLKPNLRVSPNESVAVAGDFKKPKTSNTMVSFAYKRSLKYQATYIGKLKKPIEINGVFEEKKYKASQSADVDSWGTNAGMFQIFNVDDREMKNTQAVECDGAKYEKGVTEAVSTYLKSSVDAFLAYIK